MISAIGICNLGLNHIKKREIQSFEDSSEEARKCKLVYELTRDELLRSFPWNFATKIERLAMFNERVVGWDFLYAYPQSCLKVRKIYNDRTVNVDTADTNNFQRMTANNSQAIATNVNEAWCEFTFRVIDPNQYDASFVDSFSYRLAAKLCNSLTGDTQFGERLLAISDQIAKNACLINSTEQRPLRQKYSPSIDARG